MSGVSVLEKPRLSVRVQLNKFRLLISTSRPNLVKKSRVTCDLSICTDATDLCSWTSSSCLRVGSSHGQNGRIRSRPELDEAGVRL